MKIKYSKKVLILALIVFSGVIVLNVFFANILLVKIFSINDKVNQLNISSQKRERELALKDFIVSSSLDREKLAGYFIGAGNAETVEFTKYLEDLALVAGVTQKKSLNYEAISELDSAEVVSAIRFKFNVSGKWENVFTFIQLVENLPKVLSLNSVFLNVSSEAVSVKDVKSGRKVWSADLDFSVAMLKK